MTQQTISFSLCPENIQYVIESFPIKHRNKSHWLDDLITHLRSKNEKTKVTIDRTRGLSPIKVVEIYNELFKGTYARQKEVVTDSLKSSLRTRIKNDFDSPASWSKFFNSIKNSPFLMGEVQTGDRKPFQLSLEWIVKPANMAKILEGTYHGS